MSTDLQARLRRRSTADEVADLLRTLVFSNELTTGDQLIESRLAPDLGVSRQVVRETIFRLEAEGLVERLPYRGAVVKRITADTVLEVYDVRRVLETVAIDAAVACDGDAPRVRLAGCVDAMEAADGWRAVIDADFEFHATLVEALQSARLTRYYRTLQGELRLCSALTNRGQYTPGDFVNSHRAIAAAVTSRDGALARELLLAHLELSRDDVLTALEARSEQDAGSGGVS